MANKTLYSNFYDCMVDLGNVLGVSKLEDMEAAILYAYQNDFPTVADYLQKNTNKLKWHVRKEFEEVSSKQIINFEWGGGFITWDEI